MRKFETHVSKAFQCGCDFSPDGRYVATASEDRSVSELINVKLVLR